MAPIEPLRIHTVEVAHPAAQAAIRRVDQDMILIAGKTVGMDLETETFLQFAQQLDKTFPVVVSEEHGPGSGATVGHVVPSSGEFDPQWSRHVGSALPFSKGHIPTLHQKS